MSEALQTFLDGRLPFEGLAAWSARLADRSFASHCYTDWFKPAQVEQALGRLALAAEALAHNDIQPLRVCWTFEHARIHLAFRLDGSCLAFFVENRPGLSSGSIEKVMEEFLRMG